MEPICRYLLIIIHITFISALVSANWEFAVTVKSRIIFFDENWHEIKSSAHQFNQLSALTFDEAEEVIYFNDQKYNNGGNIYALRMPMNQIHGEDDGDHLIYNNTISEISETATSVSNGKHLIQKIIQRNPDKKDKFITGIAYDPLNRLIYWVDQKERKIYFKSIDDYSNNYTAHKFLIDFKDETTIPDGVAIDICRRKLYWTNSNFSNATIESIDLDGKNRKLIVKDRLYMPHGIVVDQLSARIFWVVDQQGMHYTVESANLDGSDRKIVVRGFDSTPSNLIVTKKFIYWTDHSHTAVWRHYKDAVKSYNNHSKQSYFIMENNHNHNQNQTTDKASDNDDVINFHEEDYDSDFKELIEPEIIYKFTENPSGIVARSGYLTTLQNNPYCSNVINKIRFRLRESVNNNKIGYSEISVKTKENVNFSDMWADKKFQNHSNSEYFNNFLKKDKYCLNNGEYIAETGTCICQIGFRGFRCDINECHNFCVHGTCTMSVNGFPKCSCARGFYGERCQLYRCGGYCLNGGICRISSDGQPVCDCAPYFDGERCERNETEICSFFCRLFEQGRKNIDDLAPAGCYDVCNDFGFEEGSTDIYPAQSIHQGTTKKDLCLPSSLREPSNEKHRVHWNNTIIIVLVVGVVLCLCLVLLIVLSVKRFYKPERPRIKKTFVVRKQALPLDTTTFTHRPIATEQCEITIENCCNMNYCDTPCFDPKLVQQSLSYDSNKEDKKLLISNLEDEIY